MPLKNILVTGAAGYIGSICAYRLLKNGYKVFAFDNLSTGHIETIDELKNHGDFEFICGDLKNFDEINSVFKNQIDAVIHFAAYSLVGESQKEPLKYYENNVFGSLNLFKAMINNNVKNIVFSSTAATYGNPEQIPINEEHRQRPINVYGKTKLMIEKILDDLDNSFGLKSAKLRYFNACGASFDCLFGERHNPETHLIPNILNFDDLKVFGLDYPTPDGTCIRDYIDVEDLIDAHILALDYIRKEQKSVALNLGTKRGNSVKEIIGFCEDVTGKKIEYSICERREGDPSILVADNQKALEVLNWKPIRTIKESIEHAYKFKRGCQ